ncbi:DMT family transporter [Paenibacillus alvei]|uniref:DMT family transporter n=1 Tax=Paenibacillus alvei TaxID=44250 RepID=A0ABT4GY31_PAEAL|nr:DMT family transporter [Paenibacillus alvei]MCY9761626.1 DMT family transporter [Paenibacillus alvei]MCY9769667.1 DMT family transporter [Paenibacillus alvei]
MNHSAVRKAYIAAILNTLIIGFSFVFVKIALQSVNSLDMLAYRFTASFAAIMILVLLGKVKLNLCWKEVATIVPLAVLYPGLFFAFQTFGLVTVSASEAGIIQAAVPIFTMIFASYWLKEHSTWQQKIALLLSVSGLVYIFAMKGVNVGNTSLSGILLVFLSVLSLAGYNVAARKRTRKYGVMDVTFIMTSFGFVVFNSMAIFQHIAAGTTWNVLQPLTDPMFLLSILYLGVLSSLMTAYLTNYALSKLEAVKVSVFTQLGTLVTMGAGVIILHESLQLYHLIGAGLIIVGVLGVNIPLRQRERAGTIKKQA